MSWLKIQAENAEYQVIQSLKLNRVKRNKSREVFIEGIECIKQAIRSHIEVTRIIIKDFNQLSDWGKNTVEQYNDVT
ncbi:MAG: RNA methyltransferase, partial [Treponema sp.]|nr:RNA methyltransferase [Treponema sp.]